MRQPIFIALALLLHINFTVAQSKWYYQVSKIDSLISLLPQSTGTKRVEMLHSLVINLWLNYPDSAKKYAREAIDLSNKIGNARLQSISLRLMGTVQNFQG